MTEGETGKGSPVQAPPEKGPLEFRDSAGNGIALASVFGVGVLVSCVGSYFLLTSRHGLSILFSRPERFVEFMIQDEGVVLLAGLAVLLLGLWLMLTQHEVVIVDPARRVVVRRRGFGLHLPKRVLPFVALERAESVLRVTTATARRHGSRFHFVQVVERTGRTFKLPGVAGAQADAERIVRTVNGWLSS